MDLTSDGRPGGSLWRRLDACVKVHLQRKRMSDIVNGTVHHDVEHELRYTLCCFRCQEQMEPSHSHDEPHGSSTGCVVGQNH